MRVLFDASILLDVLLNRQPWAVESSELWTLNDENAIDGYIAASTFTDIFYIARRIKDIPTALQAIQICLSAFDVCTIDKLTIVEAYSQSGSDFEDNVLIACATQSNMDAIVTRNPSDFQHASTSVYAPADLLALFPQDESDESDETE